MRKQTLALGGAVAALFVGSIFVGVAVATTGAPVLYDARSPQPIATSSGGFGVEAGEAQGGDAPAPADGAADANDDALTPSPPAAPVAPPIETRSPTPTPSPDPAPTTPPDDPVLSAEEQQAWLGFQQLVRECMTAAGQEYRYWEWWNTEPRNPNTTAPAMPDGLTTEQQAAWRFALVGDGAGDDGCIGDASRADQAPPSPPSPPAPPAAPPAEIEAPPAEEAPSAE